MKSIFVVSILLALTFQTAFGQQINNAGLENWQSFAGYQVPDSFWTRDLSEYAFLGVASTERTTDAHSGQFAALIKSLPAGPFTTNVFGILRFGSFQTIGQTNYFGGWPFIGRPAKMTFWFKFVRAGNDTSHATVILSKWNGIHSYIGIGNLSISSNTPNYTQAEIPITYISNENPDSIIVIFGSSGNVNPTPGTMLYVDDISLEYGTEVRDDRNKIVKSYALYQNFPNPFNPDTKLKFSIARHDFTTLTIFDMIGREVKTLIQKDLSEGEYTEIWDGTDRLNRFVSSGIYLIRLKSGSFVQTKKMVLMR